MVANVTGAQIHRQEVHDCKATTAEADRHRNNLIPLQADNIVYASQTVKNNMAGEERERDKKKSIVAETHTLSFSHSQTHHIYK